MRRIFNLPSSTSHPPASQTTPPPPYPIQILSQKDFHGLRLPWLGLVAPWPGLGSSVILIFVRSFFCFLFFVACVFVFVFVFAFFFSATTPTPTPRHTPPLPSVPFEPFFMRFVAVFKFHFMHTLFLFLSLLIACLHTKNACVRVQACVCVWGGAGSGKRSRVARVFFKFQNTQLAMFCKFPLAAPA